MRIYNPFSIADGTLLLSKLKYVYVLVTSVASQSFTSGVTANCTYDTVNHDPLGLFDAGATNSLVTVPAGYTLARITSSMQFNANVTGSRVMRHNKNGAQVAGGGVSIMTTTIAAVQDQLNAVSALLAVAAGDTLSNVGLQSSGAALGTASGDKANWLCVELWG